MSDIAGIERRLDLIIALMRIGFGDSLQRQRRAVFEDRVSEEILRQCEDWTGSGDLKARVRSATKQSEPTIKRRIADLVSLGAVQRRGAGSQVSYRSTGLFEV